MSTNAGAPASGLSPRKFTWSEMTMRSPGSRSGSSPPAALVATRARQPSCAATRTATATSRASPPSPEPSTIATAGRSIRRGRITRAATTTVSAPGSWTTPPATGSATRAVGEHGLEPEDRLDRGGIDAAGKSQVDAEVVDEGHQAGEPHQRRAGPGVPQDRAVDLERLAGGDHAAGVALVLAGAVAQQDQLASRPQ